MSNTWEFFEDFFGAGTFVTTAGLDPWVITDTSAAGTPSYSRLDHGEASGTFAPGVARLKFDAQSEIQNICLSFGDVLCFDINTLASFECRLRFVAGAGAAIDTATSLSFGITGDRNDTIDSIAMAAIFRLIGSTAVLLESDDTSHNNDDIATGLTLPDSTWKTFRINFANLQKVKFYMDDADGVLVRAAPGTTFDMSAYAGGLQPFVQLQKTADTSVDAVEIDYVKLTGTRT